MTQPRTAKEVLDAYEKLQKKYEAAFHDELSEIQDKQLQLLLKFVQGLHPATSIL